MRHEVRIQVFACILATLVVVPEAVAQSVPIPTTIPAQQQGFNTGPVVPVGLSVQERLMNSSRPIVKSSDKQIRVNLRYLMLDTELRKGLYQRLGAKRLKTVGSQVPNLQTDVSNESADTGGVEQIAKSSHVTTCLLQSEEVGQLFQDMSGSEDSNVTRAPSIVLIDGQESEVTDLVQRPFLVDLQRQESEQGPLVNSVVQVLNEGMSVRLKVATTPAGRIHLASTIKLEKIIDMDAEEVFGIGDEPTSVQVPLHQRKVVYATENLEAGQTLLIDPYVTQDSKKATTNAVPILSSLPFLSESFTSTEVHDVRQHMVILITPLEEAQVTSGVQR